MPFEMISSQKRFGNSSKVHAHKRQKTQKNGHHKEYDSSKLKEEFCKLNSDYSKKLPELVKKHKGSEIKLKEPKGYAVRITDLNGTVYWGRDYMLRSWSHLYLRESTEMVVIGAIDNFPSLAKGLQLIVLVDSLGKVYFYENKVLHLIADSFRDLFGKGATFPSIESYEYGQYIEQESEEECLSFSKTDKSAEDFVQKEDEDVKQLLDFFRHLPTLSK